MSQIVEEIVQRLKSISAADRSWLLHRLSTDERRQVLNALVGEGGVKAGANGNGNGNGAANGHSHKAAVELGMDLAALKGLSAEDAVALLGSESDWTLVVLLQSAGWPWAEGFLRSLPQRRLHDLRELSDQIGSSVKPKVRDAVARIIAARVREQEPVDAGRSLFDVALERAHLNTGGNPDQRTTG